MKIDILSKVKLKVNSRCVGDRITSKNEERPIAVEVNGMRATLLCRSHKFVYVQQSLTILWTY